MKVADGFEPGAVIGPLIDTKAVEKVEAHGCHPRGIVDRQQLSHASIQKIRSWLLSVA